MKQIFFFCLCLITFAGQAQSKKVLKDTTVTKTFLLNLNQGIDNAVVTKEAAFLQKHYAPDFYFLHSTGAIDSKESWIKNVLKPTSQYLSRQHDSVQVELHGDVAVVAGSLTVKRPKDKNITGYILRYIRVYAYRQKVWQLLSHRSTYEWHLPETQH